MINWLVYKSNRKNGFKHQDTQGYYVVWDRPESEADADKIVEYKEQGKSIREIAKEMGLSR